ncbi:MAG: hypothetical protein ACJAVI_002678 [Candidatus Azotimanducaceae bacterium]|jgi:hypothetical protein
MLNRHELKNFYPSMELELGAARVNNPRQRELAS